MTDRLVNLVASAKLDASGYVDAAKKVEQANRDMAASGQALDAASVDTEKKIHRAGMSFVKLASSLDPAFAAQQKLEKSQSTLNRVFEHGAITAEQHARFMALTRREYERATTQTTGLGQATGLTRMQILTLQYTLNDVAASLASGTSPFTILMQQGGQVTQAFGGLGGTLRALITPARLLGGVVGGLAIGLGVLMAVNERAERTMRSFEASLAASGRAGDLSRAQISSLVREANRLPDVDRSAAETMVLGLLRARQIGTETYRRLIELSGNYALAVGKDAPAALAELADGLRRPAQFADQLHEKFGLMSLAQYQQIEAAQKAGKAYEGQAVILSELEKRMSGLMDRASTPLQKSFTDLGNAWNDLKRNFTDSQWISNLVGAFARLTGGVADLVESLPGSQSSLNSRLDALLRDRRTIQGQIGDLPSAVSPRFLDQAHLRRRLLATNNRIWETQNERYEYAVGHGQVKPAEQAFGDSPVRAVLADTRALSEQAKALEDARNRAAESARRQQEEQERARDSLRDQVAALGHERQALEMTDRARFIFNERLKAERNARGLAANEAAIQMALVEKEAGLYFDRKKELDDAAAQQLERTREIERVTQRTTDKITDAFVSAFDGSKTAAASFRDFMLEILREIAANSIIRPTVKTVVEGFVGGQGSSFLGSLLGSVFHQGGMAGGPAPLRAVPTALFLDAPRYHSGGVAGLKADEIPAILQRGERVIPRGATGGVSGGSTVQNFTITVSVSGQAASDPQVAAQSGRTIGMAIKAQIMDILQEQQRAGGMLYGARA